jgi:hypothetical protein
MPEQRRFAIPNDTEDAVSALYSDGTQIKLATYVQLEQAIGSQQREEATPGG